MAGIFITGASGFIGSNLTDKLLANGTKIFALTRKSLIHPDPRVQFIQGDIREPGCYIPFLKECNLVFHCAACISFQKKDFQKALEVNVEGTKELLDACYKARVQKVVYLSACAVLGFSQDENGILDESSDPVLEKDNVYAYTKRLAEEEVQKYCKKGLHVSIANIATVYGQKDKKLNSGSIIQALYRENMRLLPPGGTSFVSVDDLVDGLILLAEKGKSGERYIFCSENMRFFDLVKRIAGVLEVKPPKFVLPRLAYYPAYTAVKILEFFSRFSKKEVNLMTTQILKESFGFKYFSSMKAEKQLGWRPVQEFEETIKKAVAYYKKNELL